MRNGKFEILIITLLFFFQLYDGNNKLFRPSRAFSEAPLGSPQSRYEFERMKYCDPATGQIPNNIRAQASAFLSRMEFSEASRQGSGISWKQIGPYNVGGRTRALAIDIKNENVIIAGHVSGGIWRSQNKGSSWKRVTGSDMNPSISCITQDKRAGKENIWYAGTGEPRGASQSGAGLSASFGGNGLYKSVDNGESWSVLPSLVNQYPQQIDSTDLMWRVLVNYQSSNDEIIIATSSGVYRSVNGGVSWKIVLGTSSDRGRNIDIAQTSEGVFYAALSANGINDGGIYRSTNGEDWIKINSSSFPTQFGRVVLATSLQNPKSLYLLAESPGIGKIGRDFRGNAEYHSLYKYTYLAGDGAGNNGIWTNLSANLPDGPYLFDDYISQGGYCMDVAVSPFDSNLIAIGGTNLYVSTDGFQSNSNIRYAGGYGQKTNLPDFQVYKNHHPDIQNLVFSPFNKKELYCASDGGIHMTTDVYDTSVVWLSLNNGYYSTQFYTLAVDPRNGSTRVMGGTQDNGTLLTNSLSNTVPWTLPWSYDGAYCSFSEIDSNIYAAKQLAGIMKIRTDGKGERQSYIRIDPLNADTSNYLFINPYMLDPTNHNRMYLLNGNKIWVNESLHLFTPDNSYNKQTTGWKSHNLGQFGSGSCLDVSVNPKEVVYVGTTSAGILKITNAASASPTIEAKTTGIRASGYVSDITIDPRNSDRVIAVFSNYNSYSVFFTENGGDNWTNISGNIEGKRPPGVPASAAFVNDGPSCRSALIIPMGADSSLYLLGTSVGLFYTSALDGETTHWTAMDPSTLGNVIVEDIQYRASDKFIAIATHGAGIFTGSLSDFSSNPYVSVNNIKTDDKSKLTLFPNPSTRGVVHITNTSGGLSPKSVIQIINLNGKVVQQHIINDSEVNHGIVKLDIRSLSKGLYFVSLAQDSEKITGRLVVY